MRDTAKTDKPLLFIQFAGQGVRYIDDLSRLYQADARIRDFIDAAISEIHAQAGLYDDTVTGFFSQGLDVKKWIKNPADAPDIGYLLSSPVSHPLIFLTQICNYLALLNQGVDQEALLENVHSVTGFSTGVVAAILVSMNLPYDRFVQMALKVQAMFVWQGIRTQESMFNIGARPAIQASLYGSPEGSPCCMASINNLTKSRLDAVINAFSETSNVHPAYELLPWRWVIAGLTEDLETFKTCLAAIEPKAVFRYIPSTIAAHSPFLKHALKTSPLDAARLGLRFSGDDMQLPVWANDTGEDLRDKADIIYEVMEAYFIKPACWRKQIKPVKPPAVVSYVLDFGPGTGVATLTENHTVNTGVNVIRCSIPFGRHRIVNEILPMLTH